MGRGVLAAAGGSGGNPFLILSAQKHSKNTPAPSQNVEKRSKNIPWSVKRMFFERFGIKNGFPPEPPAAARTPRPIFDDKTLKKLSFNAPGNVFGAFFHIFRRRRSVL